MNDYPSYHKPRDERIEYDASASYTSVIQWKRAAKYLEKIGPAASVPAMDTACSPSSERKQTGTSFVSTPMYAAQSTDDSDLGDDCVLCVEPLDHSLPCSELKACKHRFHTTCIKERLKHYGRCPICGKLTATVPQGTCPSGIMKISASMQICPGFERMCKTIQIDYSIPSGYQMPYHENPGRRFDKTFRTAYLPNNKQGRELLTRLKFAWGHGLTFNIGTSLTTGRCDQVVWSSIHHKTSLEGGLHGFPDPRYIMNCNSELNALGVPPAKIASKPSQHKEVIVYDAPQTLSNDDKISSALRPVPQSKHSINVSGLSKPTTLLAPAVSAQNKILGEECCICFEDLGLKERTRIRKCSHIFHTDCLKDCIKIDSKCPICRGSIGDGPHGKSPSGTMWIKLTNRPFLSGYAPHMIKVVQIDYSIPAGTQAPHHINPGVPYEGTNRTAYLPSTTEACILLTRLKYAWSHGLTFTIGRSLTTGKDNTVVWSSIHHKTSLQYGDAHGFPDPNYVANCNASLDALGVPSADDIIMMYSSQQRVGGY